MRKGVRSVGKRADKTTETPFDDDFSKHILENSSDFITVLDRGGRIRFLNHTMSGIAKGDVIGKSLYSYIDSEHGAKLRKSLAQAFRTGKMVTMDKHRGPALGGGTAWYETRFMPIREGRRIASVMLIARDITERKKAEEALQESEVKYRTLFQTAKDAIFLADENGMLIDVNRTACESLGYTKEELLKLGIKDIDADFRGRQAFQKLRGESAKELTFEVNQRRKDGTILPVEITGNFLITGGKQALLAIARDITERKETDNALKESEEKYRTIFESANDIILFMDNRGRILDANKKVEDVFGYKPDEVIGKNFAKLGVLGIKVLPTMIKLFGNAVRGGKPLGMLELEARNKKGGKVYIEASTRLIKKDGKIEGTLNILRDITGRKKADERFRILFESSRDAIMTLAPPSWKFTSGNPATVRLFNVKDEKQFTSVGPWQVSPEYQPDGQPSSGKAKKMIMKAMKEGSNFFEWTHKTLDGKEFPTTVLLTRVEIEKGKPFLQATVRDIIEQKKAGEALRKKANELERFNKIAIGRELRMVELKKRIKVLEAQLERREK